MHLYTNQLFHIYNQGNNSQTIFFHEENYHYFLWKMRAYLLPFGDLVAYCLMPTHFHWLFFIQKMKVNKISF
jgi:putative transposase